jgi:pimeloyl-ACP methyl ester carboxylesterase
MDEIIQLVNRFDLALPDGRSIDVLTSGPANGMLLLFHVGTPMAAVHYEPLTRAAASFGLRTVTYSRPGYGRSTRQPGYALADAAGDVRAILDRLGADRFVTLGWSGGGSRALACAAILRDRCAAAASVSAVAPYSAVGPDWFTGMSDGNVVEFSAAIHGEAALATYLEEAAKTVGNLQTDAVMRWIGPIALAPDTASAAGSFAEFVATSFRESVSQGIGGWLDDDLALTRDWRFDLTAIERPVAIWHGGKDTLVPFSHGVWLAQNIPRARAHFHEQHDHMTLPVAMLDRIVADLIEMAR